MLETVGGPSFSSVWGEEGRGSVEGSGRVVTLP